MEVFSLESPKSRNFSGGRALRKVRPGETGEKFQEIFASSLKKQNCCAIIHTDMIVIFPENIGKQLSACGRFQGQKSEILSKNGAKQ